MATQISNFTKGGSRVSGVKRPGIATSPLGRLDPTTGIVWQRPRLTLNPLAGRSVKMTNPRASLPAANNVMTASLGMKGVGQRGRNRDVGSAKAPAEG